MSFHLFLELLDLGLKGQIHYLELCLKVVMLHFKLCGSEGGL